MSKEKKSKLDQFTERLDDWFGVEKKTIAEVQAQLKLDGCSVSSGRLSEWWEARRQFKLEEHLLSQIATGANQIKTVEQEFSKNPAPELETIIKLHRVLILQLSTKGAANPEFLKLSDQLTNTVLNCISAQTKAAFKEREVSLAESKAKESKKTDQQKALEYCLAESKGTPAEEHFKLAFAALKKAKAK